MAVDITKTFWAFDDASPAWKLLQKVVFTSPHMDSPRSAGSRSHILPGSNYIGTWYEALDLMHRVYDDQSYPINTRECYFSEFILYQDTFDFDVDTTISGLCKYDPATIAGSVLHYDRDNYCVVNSQSYKGNVNIEGTTYRKYEFTAVTSGTGTATISGSWTTTSGSARFYSWPNNTTNTPWSHAQNSVIFEATNGEAYNCRLTAWDDETHTTTSNKILDEEHYKVVVYTYKAGHVQSGGSLGSTVESPGTQKELPRSNNIVDAMVHPPGIDIVLKGNEKYYGDFDLVHVPVEYVPHGEYLVFTPYLYGMNSSFTPGNYDFVTTLHYQYT